MTSRFMRPAFGLSMPLLSRHSAVVLPVTRICPARTARHARCALMSVGDGDDLAHAMHTPWHHPRDFGAPFAHDSNGAPWLEGDAAAPPTGGSSGGRDDGGDSGGSGGGDGGGGCGDSEVAYAALLERYGRGGERLTADVAQLPAAQLEAYLKATRNPVTRWLASVWPGWRRRVAADGDFPFKVLMEETVGLGLAASGMIAARGKDIMKEIDFAVCDIAVGGTLNFILVYLLTPAVAVGGAGVATRGVLGGMVKGLPANAFSAGAFSMQQRAAGFLVKGALFAGCGFGGAVLGTTMSQVLVGIRRMVGNSEEEARPLPNVLANSAAWAGFMFVSSNPRYQAVAGVERALFGLAPGAVAKVASAALRTGNNVLGGAQWVWWARAIGLQEKVAEEAE